MLIHDDLFANLIFKQDLIKKLPTVIFYLTKMSHIGL